MMTSPTTWQLHLQISSLIFARLSLGVSSLPVFDALLAQVAQAARGLLTLGSRARAVVSGLLLPLVA